MCGFGGIWNSSGENFAHVLPLMGQALHHRGPDSGNNWSDTDAGIALVHQRLAVVDISPAGEQPMATPDGRYIICFNGEIYNHVSIRKKIEAKLGTIAWRGTSDTETLLMSIVAFGLNTTIELSVGMFALALWDRQSRHLSLVRDRFGEKPLYYGWHQQRFVFASELKAIESVPGLNLSIDPDALSLYFRHNYIPAPYSIYNGIRKLEPGCMLTLKASDAKAEHRCYWSATEKARQQSHKPFTGTLPEAVQAVESSLNKAIKGQIIADVPVGAFLSGGIDSSTVVALMQKHSTTKVNTFSIGFDDEKLNEAHHASAVAGALNTNHTELYLSNTDMEHMVQSLPAITDEPFADSSLLPTLAVSKLARQSVTVSLSGDGGDELFGGYSRYLSASKVMSIRKLTRGPGRMIAAAIIASPLMTQSQAGLPQWRWPAINNKTVGFHSSMLLQLLSQKRDAMAYRELISFWRNSHSPMLASTSPATYFHNPERWLDNNKIPESIQMMDTQTYLPDDILAKVDRASMSVSLETRVPMLDHRFAELVWSLPPEYRTHHKQFNHSTKPVLKAIAAQYVPIKQLERTKMGFGVPLDTWLQGPLCEWAEALIEPNTIKKQGILDPSVVSALWTQVQQGHERAAELMWSILMFQHWLKHSPVGIG